MFIFYVYVLLFDRSVLHQAWSLSWRRYTSSPVGQGGSTMVSSWKQGPWRRHWEIHRFIIQWFYMLFKRFQASSDDI